MLSEGVRDRLRETTIRAGSRVLGVRGPVRTDVVQFAMTVRAVTDVASQVRRVTCAAPELLEYAANGPDEYFGLLMPGPSGLHLPDDGVNVRRSVARMPAEDRPGLRWYTIRAVRPDSGEIDVDIVRHGDAGPGTAWAGRVEVGDRAGFRQGTALYADTWPQPQLLVADETGAPALAAILEAWAAPTQPVAIVEVPDLDHLSPLPAGVEVTVVERGSRTPGSAALQAVQDRYAAGSSLGDELGFAWVCGESQLATAVRRHLVKGCGLDRRRVMFSGFWKLGAARE